MGEGCVLRERRRERGFGVGQRHFGGLERLAKGFEAAADSTKELRLSAVPDGGEPGRRGGGVSDRQPRSAPMTDTYTRIKCVWSLSMEPG